MPGAARPRTDLRSAAAREGDHATTDVDRTTTNGVDDLVRAYREANGLADDVRVPVDAVTRRAAASTPFLGEPGVNVLMLNLALDDVS